MQWITCGLTESNRKRITNIWFMLEITRICRFIYLFFVFFFFCLPRLFIDSNISCDPSCAIHRYHLLLYFFLFSFSCYLLHYAHLAVQLNKPSFILKCLNKICILYFVLLFTVRPFRCAFAPFYFVFVFAIRICPFFNWFPIHVIWFWLLRSICLLFFFLYL